MKLVDDPKPLHFAPWGFWHPNPQVDAYARKRESMISFGFLDTRFRGYDIKKSFSASCSLSKFLQNQPASNYAVFNVAFVHE